MQSLLTYRRIAKETRTKHEEREVAQRARNSHSSLTIAVNQDDVDKTLEEESSDDPDAHHRPRDVGLMRQRQIETPEMPQENTPSEAETNKEDATIMVEVDGPSDQANPQNWPTWKRTWTVSILFLLVFSQGWTSTCDSNIVKAAAAEFHVSETVETLATALFLLGLASGSLVAGPLSEEFGRNPVYLGSTLVYLLFTLGCALAPNFGAQLAFRFLAGVFSSPSLSIYGGSLADLFSDEERSIVWPIFALSPLLSPVMSPIAGGWIVDYIDWRWTYWISLILSGVAFLLALCFLPETFSGMMLQWRAHHLRHVTGNKNYSCELSQREPLQKRLVGQLTRPAQFFTTEPIIMALGAYLVIVYVVIFTFLNGFEFVFADTYGLSDGITALAFVAICIGALVSTAITPAWWAYHRRILRKGHYEDLGPPELRLFPAMAAAPFFAISLFWLGWTNFASISYWSGYVACGVFGYAMTAIFVSSYIYIIDSYGTWSSSALGSITMARYFVSAGMIVASRPMYKGIGVHWSLTLLGCLGLIMVPVPFVLYKYGDRIRAKSKFAKNDEDGEDEEEGEDEEK